MKGFRLLIVIVVSVAGFSCQATLSEDSPKNGSNQYPLLAYDAVTQDTNYKPPLSLPYQWMDTIQEVILQDWLSGQNGISKGILKDSHLITTLIAPQRIIGFPEKKGDSYFSLADFDGDRGIYKGSDLSTLNSYKPFYLDEALKLPDYQIHDFFLLDSATNQLGLLLYQESLGQYRPAFLDHAKDSLVIWTNLDIDLDWQVSDSLMLVHSPQEATIYQIQFSDASIEGYSLADFAGNTVQLIAILDGTDPLIQVNKGRETKAYYRLSLNSAPKEIFTFRKGTSQWLAFQEGQHYFRADFDQGVSRIYSFQSSAEQDLLRTIVPNNDSTLIHTQIQDSLIITLRWKPAYAQLEKYNLQGKRLSNIELKQAIVPIDFQYYPSLESTLVRQLNISDGLSWLNVNETFPVIVEPVYRSLKDLTHFPVSQEWRSIRSYDGAFIPIVIYQKKVNSKPKNQPTLVIPVSSDLEAFRLNMLDFSIANRCLQNNGIVILVFPRGNKKMGQNWFLQGAGPLLQLAYDDLQASISYLNEQKIGHPAFRTVWGIEEGALSAAALFLQRPDLARNVVLQEGVYDLRSGQTSAKMRAFDWINTADSLSKRLSVKYSPQFYPIQKAFYPNCLVQTSNQSIFADCLQSYKFVSRLQGNISDKQLLLYSETINIRNSGTPNKDWEQMVWKFINL